MRRLAAPHALATGALVALLAIGAGACPKPQAGTSPVSPAPDLQPSSMPSSQPSSQPSSMPSAAPSGGATGMSTMDHDGHGKAARTDREHTDADGVVRRGTPLTASLDATPVSAAVTRARDLDGKTVKLTGTVSDVCTKMGCWFVVQGEKPEDKIRISTKAHNIFVPRSSVGMTATVEGTLAVKMLDAKTAQHFEDERELKPGEQRRTITTEVPELAIDVVGLELRRAG